MACLMCEERSLYWGEDVKARIETAVEGHKQLHIEVRDMGRRWNIVFPIKYCPECGEKLNKEEER